MRGKVTKNKQNKSGISLLVLVITIVVIIILAAAVIVSFTINNPIRTANEARFKSDISAFKSELLMYKSNKLVDDLGNYNQKLLNANKVMMEEMGQIQAGKTMLDIIPSMTNTKYYEEGLLKVVKGELVYIGDDEDEKKWAINSGLAVENVNIEILNILTNITTNSAELDVKLLQKKTRPVTYEVQISEDNGATYIVKEHTRKDTTDGANGSVILIENLKNEKTYKVKVIATDEKSNRTEKEIDITTIEIEKAEITGTPATWTNVNVEVAIKYPEGVNLTNEYSLDEGTTWIIVTSNSKIITVEENKNVYARIKDNVGNEVVSTKSIDNIDKVLPNDFTPTVVKTTNSITISGSTTDGLSAIKGYQYSMDGKNWYPTNDTVTIDTTHTFTNLVQGIAYSPKMRAIDNAGNVLAKTTSETTDILTKPEITVTPTTWTNENVTATITYPNVEGTTKKYSYDGKKWTTLTGLTETLTITENKTVYAIITDSTNQTSGNVTKSIDNIDKTSPNAFIIKLTSQTPTSFIINASTTDALSGIKEYQYYIDNVLKYTGLNTKYTAKEIDSAISHTVVVKAYDNALNERSSNTINVPIANYTLTVTSNDISSGTVTGSGSYVPRTNVTITATPNSGYIFDKWNDGNTSNPRQVTVTSNQTYTAAFTRLLVGYNTPRIPEGFTHITGTWDTGYVIQDDTNGNEFVWVPVKLETEYKRGVTGDTREINGTPTKGIYENDEDATNIAIKESVLTHGGFYIGRYETGLNEEATYNSKATDTKWENATPVVKKDARPWNYITHPKAIEISKNMYTGTTKSALINSYIWDTTLNWIISSGAKTQSEVVIGSVRWGNYKNAAFTFDDSAKYSTDYGKTYLTNNKKKPTNNGWLLTTGATTRNSANNIYDLAGNLFEWTTEVLDSTGRVNRGGYYIRAGDGVSSPATGRNSSNSDGNSSSIVFRLALFW